MRTTTCLAKSTRSTKSRPTSPVTSEVQSSISKSSQTSPIAVPDLQRLHILHHGRTRSSMRRLGYCPSETALQWSLSMSYLVASSPISRDGYFPQLSSVVRAVLTRIRSGHWCIGASSLLIVNDLVPNEQCEYTSFLV